MRSVRLFVVGIAVAVFVTLALPAIAEPQADEEETPRMKRDTKWGFSIAPYGWLTGVAGTVVTDGNGIDIDIPFEDIFERSRGLYELYFEARRNKVFMAFDGTWATLGGEMETRLVDLDIEVRQRIYDIRVGYEVYNTELGDVIHRPKFDWQRRGIIDVFVGGRYFQIEPAITIIGAPGEQSITDSRIDPFLGLRIGWDMSYRWAVGFRGDIGGFGIGDAAQLSWQASGEFGFRLSRRVVIIAGYRYLEYDTVAGEAGDRNGVDLRQQGPIIGVGIKL